MSLTIFSAFYSEDGGSGFLKNAVTCLLITWYRIVAELESTVTWLCMQQTQCSVALSLWFLVVTTVSCPSSTATQRFSLTGTVIRCMSLHMKCFNVGTLTMHYTQNPLFLCSKFKTLKIKGSCVVVSTLMLYTCFLMVCTHIHLGILGELTQESHG